VYLFCFSTIIFNRCVNKAEIVATTPTNNSDLGGSFSLIQDKILTPSCATAGCHASNTDASFKQHGLVLAKGVAYKNLVGVDCQNTNAKADGYKLVKAFKSLESLFYHKLNWDNSHHSSKNYGSSMPLGGESLFVGQVEFIRRWIEAGAPETGSVADANLLNDRTPSVTTTFVPLPTPKSEGVDGYQMYIEPFTIAPNFEREIFVRKPIGNTVDIYVNRIKFRSRPNSHHMVVYDFADKNSLPELNLIRDLRNSENGLNINTVLQIGNHIFLGGGSDSNAEYKFPEGIALQIPAKTTVDLNPHYFNKTNFPLTGENYVNFYTAVAAKVTKIAKNLNLTNTKFTLPAKQKTTITYSTILKTDTKIFMLTSHTHRLGEKFVIQITGGSRDGEVVYENTDWEHPLVKNFDTPIALKKGEGLTSVVTYNNTTDKTVGFGFTTDDEMDIIFGYYYEGN
jgi:hypothetical protein